MEKALQGVSCLSHVTRWRSPSGFLDRWKSLHIGPHAFWLNKNHCIILNTCLKWMFILGQGWLSFVKCRAPYFYFLTYWNLTDIWTYWIIHLSNRHWCAKCPQGAQHWSEHWEEYKRSKRTVLVLQECIIHCVGKRVTRIVTRGQCSTVQLKYDAAGEGDTCCGKSGRLMEWCQFWINFWGMCWN